ncbi:segregation and condensation protein A [Lactobacillus sp. PV037]|uniref:segregation and condensation protein A n=1 Tax=unclassified Lactobacillus TaxID=2620435 RepID=UPI0022408039|nr:MULTISPECIES: segregation/condensation protein A [unclassified Lactobacillus]QNQ82366.1 segregation and condensation protein A [Lactobacillus sp. PV012]QNQ83520.1 segregation and condensation protein A [Lactobacillus sp. PV037]
MNKNDLTLNLPNFSGPLDLLLHLIKSQEIDIYDIPIAQITKQYLDHLNYWQKLDLQIAGEYFVMASTLLRIKSQYLLPKNDFVEIEEQDEDPRTELVEQLIQYSVFKRVSEYLKEKGEQSPVLLAKEPSSAPEVEVVPLPLGEMKESDLVYAFKNVLHRFKLKNPIERKIEIAEVSIEEMTAQLSEQLNQKNVLSFFSLVSNFTRIDEVVSLFLSILELEKNHQIVVSQTADFGDIRIERRAEGEKTSS